MCRSRWPCGTSGPPSPPPRWPSSRRRPALRSTGARSRHGARGIGFATLTHAAGISSTGDPALDLRLPFDEPYRIPGRTAARSRARGSAAETSSPSAPPWCARSKPPPSRRQRACRRRRRQRPYRAGTRLQVVDAILTGVHQPGESHFELLRAFADDALLDRSRGARLAWLPRARVRQFPAAVSSGEPAGCSDSSRLAACAGPGTEWLLWTERVNARSLAHVRTHPSKPNPIMPGGRFAEQGGGLMRWSVLECHCQRAPGEPMDTTTLLIIILICSCSAVAAGTAADAGTSSWIGRSGTSLLFTPDGRSHGKLAQA